MHTGRSILSLLLGVVFLLSGGTKGIDPYGVSLSMEEYLQWLGWEVLCPYAQPLAVGLCIGELWLGFLLLAGFRERIVAYAAAGVLGGFTVLTGMLAFDPQGGLAECGCFGKAVELSPLATFGKNVALLALSAWYVFLVERERNRLSGRTEQAGRRLRLSERYAGLCLGYCLLLAASTPLYSLVCLPPFDFLPYNRGTDLKERAEFRLFDAAYREVTSEFFGPDGRDSTTGRYTLFLTVQSALTEEERTILSTSLEESRHGQATLCLQAAPGVPGVEGLTPCYIEPVLLKSLIRAPKGLLLLDGSRVAGKWPLSQLSAVVRQSADPESLIHREKQRTACYAGGILLGLIPLAFFRFCRRGRKEEPGAGKKDGLSEPKTWSV